MLSYRHAFHAGNHADVFKHNAMLLCFRYLRLKPGSVLYVESHAGAGGYGVSGGFLPERTESADGIDRLLANGEKAEPPTEATEYLDLVRRFRTDRGTGAYPGSPALAQAGLRPQDRAVLFELHPADFAALAAFAAGDERIQVRRTDGLAGLRSVLPPLSRRALVLIDPSYEIKDDFPAVAAAAADTLKRFATGVLMVWYPLLGRPNDSLFPDSLLGLGTRPRLKAELRVRRDRDDGYGLNGSGLIVFNPPWPLQEELRRLLPYLAAGLRQDDGAAWSVNYYQ